MKKKLFLITDTYPYGRLNDGFMKPELPYLLERFDVTLVSCADAKKQSEMLNPVDERIGVMGLVPGTSFCAKVKIVLQALWSADMWREWRQIVREGRKISSRLYFALSHYVNSESFYRQLVREADIDGAVVYCYWNNVRALGICRHKHEHKGLKIVSRVHGYDLYNERGFGGRQYFRWLVNRELDAIFFVSQKGLAYYRDTFQVQDTDKLFFCPLGISEMPMSPAPQAGDDFVLVSCSNVIPLKRVDLIVRGLAKVNTKRKVHWIHFGDGSEMSHVRDLGQKLLAGRDNISYELKGREENVKIRRYYVAHAINSFITTSSTEGAPISIQEALCAAVPIIGTNEGGIPEMIDGNGILLSSSPSPEEVAEAIEKMVNLPAEKYLAWKKRSREIWQEKYMAEKNYRRFLETLVEVTE